VSTAELRIVTKDVEPQRPGTRHHHALTLQILIDPLGHLIFAGLRDFDSLDQGFRVTAVMNHLVSYWHDQRQPDRDLRFRRPPFNSLADGEHNQETERHLEFQAIAMRLWQQEDIPVESRQRDCGQGGSKQQKKFQVKGPMQAPHQDAEQRQPAQDRERSQHRRKAWTKITAH
jgi:hypothetical protein